MQLAAPAAFFTECRHSVRKHRVHGRFDGEIRSVALTEFDCRIMRARLRQHLERRVDPNHRGSGLGNRRSQLAGATAEIENPLTFLRRKQVQHRLSILKYE